MMIKGHKVVPLLPGGREEEASGSGTVRVSPRSVLQRSDDGDINKPYKEALAHRLLPANGSLPLTASGFSRRFHG